MNIENHNSNKILTGSNYNDFINNYVGPVTINGLDGNDNIRNSFATTRRNDYVLINSGTGNDLISNDGKYATVNGDEDNDLIFNLSNNSTISGGTGDDTIANNVWEDRFYGGAISYLGSSSGNNILFNYAEGDGNDIIYGFKDNSTLSITGSGYFTTKSGNDIIVSVGEGEITLSGETSEYLPTAAMIPLPTPIKTFQSRAARVTILSIVTTALLQSTAAQATIPLKTSARTSQ